MRENIFPYSGHACLAKVYSSRTGGGKISEAIKLKKDEFYGRLLPPNAENIARLPRTRTQKSVKYLHKFMKPAARNNRVAAEMGEGKKEAITYPRSGAITLNRHRS